MARKKGITRADVAAAAGEVADREGLDAVTPGAVADRLGIRTPSLYAHVDGMGGLRRLLALEAARTMADVLEHATEGRRGVDALGHVAVAYRWFALKHPGRYAAVQRAVRPGEDDELYEALGAVVAPALRALGEAGVAATEQVHLARAFRSALHGFVSLEVLGGFGRPESVEDSYRRLVELLLGGVRAAAGTMPGQD